MEIKTPAGRKRPRAVVMFAHGSGSSRFSPNRRVAAGLRSAGLATVSQVRCPTLLILGEADPDVLILTRGPWPP
jgi:hypothetical protein